MSNAAPQTPSFKSLDDLAGLDDLMPTRFTATGTEFRMGEMVGIQAAIPIVTWVGLAVDEVITRRDYEIEGIEPGNRAISEPHAKKIMAGLRRHAKKFVTGAFTLAVHPDGVKIDRMVPLDESGSTFIVRFSIKSGHQVFIVDAQHRDQAVRELWKETVEAVRDGSLAAEEVARLMGQTSIPVLILLEGEKDEISRLFVTMGNSRPIPASLIAVMDREQFANRVGLEVAQRARLLGGTARLAYQTATATGDKLYPAAAIRGAAANMFIGFRDRTPDMREMNLRRLFEADGKDPESDETVREAADEIVSLLDYAYERIPGWRELYAATIEPKEFRPFYVHGTASGLYVIAGVICAARLSPGVDPEHVIDLMATEIEWEREARVQDNGGPMVRHPDFEGSLVVNEPVLNDDGNIVGWKTRTAGGARTSYEKATRRVIDRLIQIDPDLSEMRSDTVQVEMGLKAAGRRGRPRKQA